MKFPMHHPHALLSKNLLSKKIVKNFKEFNLKKFLNRSKNTIEKGNNLEKMVCNIFKNMGYDDVVQNGASVSKTNGDGGIDIIVKRNGKKTLIQCKNQKASIGVNQVREISGIFHQKKNADVSEFWLITTSKFASGAIECASEFNRDNKDKRIILKDYKWIQNNAN